MYNTAEQIKEAFVKDGWAGDIEFEELTKSEAKRIGSWSILRDMERGKKFFRMVATGNIFDSRGKVVVYNIPTIKDGAQNGSKQCCG